MYAWEETEKALVGNKKFTLPKVGYKWKILEQHFFWQVVCRPLLLASNKNNIGNNFHEKLPCIGMYDMQIVSCAVTGMPMKSIFHLFHCQGFCSKYMSLCNSLLILSVGLSLQCLLGCYVMKT